MADSYPIVVLDNGAGKLKIGFAGEESPRLHVPNCKANVRKSSKTYIAEQVQILPEYFLHRPIQRGLLVDIDMQRDIWSACFSKRQMSIEPTEHAILVTEPFKTPASIRHVLSEVLFEDFGFREMVICPAQQLVPYAFRAPMAAHPGDTSDALLSVSLYGDTLEPTTLQVPAPLSTADCLPIPTSADLPGTGPAKLVLDCGFHTCTAMPIYQGVVFDYATKRMDMGGFHLNAYLKNLLAFRQVDLGANELLVERIKDTCCRLSLDFMTELSQVQKEMQAAGGHNAPSHLQRLFALPDYNVKDKALIHQTFACVRRSRLKGPRLRKVPADSPFSPRVTEPLSVLVDLSVAAEGIRSVKLNNEVICVPEILFNPSDAGLSMMGIPQMIYQAIMSCPPELQPFCSSCILVSGGTTMLPNFCWRLYRDLKALLPQSWPLRLYHIDDPDWGTWRGGSQWASNDFVFKASCLSRNQYAERGP